MRPAEQLPKLLLPTDRRGRTSRHSPGAQTLFPTPLSQPLDQSFLAKAECCARAHPGWPGKGLHRWLVAPLRGRSPAGQNICLQASNAPADIACKPGQPRAAGWACRDPQKQRCTWTPGHGATRPSVPSLLLQALPKRGVSSLSHDQIPLKTAENTNADGN